MKKLLQILEVRFLAAIAAALVINCSSIQAQNEDSCKAFMNVTPDHFDPLLIHFEFTGTVPIGSFQFLGSWDFGDGNTSMDSCPVHLYAQPGTYVVCLSFSICIGGGLSCHDDTCVSITIGNIAGVENTDGNLHRFYSYPDPVKSAFHLRSDSNKDLQLKVTDFAGRIVYYSKVRNDEPIDASAFANGIYFLEASDGVRTLKKKMVVQK